MPLTIDSLATQYIVKQYNTLLFFNKYSSNLKKCYKTISQFFLVKIYLMIK